MVTGIGPSAQGTGSARAYVCRNHAPRAIFAPCFCGYQHKSSIRLLLMVHAVRCEMVTCGMVLLPRAGGWEQCDGLKRT